LKAAKTKTPGSASASKSKKWLGLYINVNYNARLWFSSALFNSEPYSSYMIL
jgi:hypothetical protein